MKTKNTNSLFKIKGEHENLTYKITILCLERSLKRIKAQIKHFETMNDPYYLSKTINEFKTIN